MNQFRHVVGNPRRRADPRGPQGSRLRPQGARERAGPPAEVGGAARRRPDRRREHRRTARPRGRPPVLHRPGLDRLPRPRAVVRRLHRRPVGPHPRREAGRRRALPREHRVLARRRRRVGLRAHGDLRREGSRAPDRGRDHEGPGRPDAPAARRPDRAPGTELRSRHRRARARTDARDAPAGLARGFRRHRGLARALRPDPRPRGRRRPRSPGFRRGRRSASRRRSSYASTPRQQVQALHRELVWAKKTGKPDARARGRRAAPGRVPRGAAAHRPRRPRRAMPELGRGTEIKAGLLAALVGAAAWEAEQLAEDAIAPLPAGAAALSGRLRRRPGGRRVGLAVRVREDRRDHPEQGRRAYAAEDRAAAALLEEGRRPATSTRSARCSTAIPTRGTSKRPGSSSRASSARPARTARRCAPSSGSSPATAR